MSQNETSGTVAVDNQKIKTKQMVLIALMTAVTCVLGPLSIPLPFSPVPISLTNFAIFLAIFVLGMKNGTISFIIYLCSEQLVSRSSPLSVEVSRFSQDQPEDI